eukprot:CAMPEP_0194393276 /NCGR_PEP_ID=MMETSP0174-20130528/123209_1 /TAXON_ID=216777 /ORGANISM="Proboscia alata, Strain PI-D3" /LENGTH=478 /DNA_ID=CAMNT_0039188943 /DNA_START=890 /DNA_END=2324 /DNA_ORIENTATION=-
MKGKLSIAHESVPEVSPITAVNNVSSQNSSGNNVENNNEMQIVYDATHVLHAHIVEPVIFASAKPPSFLQNKKTRNCVLGIVLITSLVSIVWSIAGSLYPSIPFQMIEPENFILKSMNLDNVAMQIRGVVSGNNPVTISLWINATDEHIKDFYAANEDFGIIVTKIETVFLEDLFTEQEDTGVIEIRYSQVFNFYTKDNSTIAENFALTPFSTRQGKSTYIASLKRMNEMYSKVYDIGDVFTFTSYPSGLPTISSKPSISTSPTDLTSLYPNYFPPISENRNRNNVRRNIETHIVHDATHVNAHVVEPIMFASATTPSFLQNKNKRNCFFGIVLITSFVCIVWSIAGYMNPSIPFQIIEPENLIPKSMNLDNIAMQIRGVVSGNNPLTTSLWINATDEHIKDFYAANEDFGISVTKIETVFLEDLFTEQEDTGVIEIRYSHVFNFYTADNSTTAENFALTPFSTRQGKSTYIASLKSM